MKRDRSLTCANIFENMNRMIRQVCRNVKRRQDVSAAVILTQVANWNLTHRLRLTSSILRAPWPPIRPTTSPTPTF